MGWLRVLSAVCGAHLVTPLMYRTGRGKVTASFFGLYLRVVHNHLLPSTVTREEEAYSPAALLNINDSPDRSGKTRQIAGGDRFLCGVAKICHISQCKQLKGNQYFTMTPRCLSLSLPVFFYPPCYFCLFASLQFTYPIFHLCLVFPLNPPPLFSSSVLLLSPPSLPSTSFPPFYLLPLFCLTEVSTPETGQALIKTSAPYPPAVPLGTTCCVSIPVCLNLLSSRR